MECSVSSRYPKVVKINVQQTRAPARRKQIARMRKAGLTYGEIGLGLGISRERVRQILNSKVNKPPKTSRIKPPLRTSAIARLLNIHTNTVRRWSNKGILKAYRIGPRGDRRFKQKDINSLFKKERIPG
jgi:excisionase family DNA binding protein